jgi:hypothetical protein
MELVVGKTVVRLPPVPVQVVIELVASRMMAKTMKNTA